MPFYENFSASQPTGAGAWHADQEALNALRAILKVKPDVRSVLEIGPGRGPFMRACDSKPLDYTCVDISWTLLKGLPDRKRINALVPPLDNQRRGSTRIPLADLLARYNPDYKIVFVGDAAMGPYEITHPGGSVEHWNPEPGEATFRRLRDHFRKLVWINPTPTERWRYTMSTQLVRELVEGQMYPLTPDGLSLAMRGLM